jgi:hypothetical protein
MPDTVVLIHTISHLIRVFDQLAANILPGVQVKHILDEPLAEGIRQRGGLSASDSARLWDHIKAAESIRARAVLVTCSILSPLLDNLSPLTALPLIKIDQAMFAAAVQSDSHLVVLGTNPSALRSAQDMANRQARDLRKEISCEFILIEGAYSALLDGRVETHDRLIQQALNDYWDSVDGIVLAQASMARVLETIPEAEGRVTVFSSPRMAMEQVKRALGELGWG